MASCFNTTGCTVRPDENGNWIGRIRLQRALKRRVAALGACSTKEREAALDWFVALGDAGADHLYGALRASVCIACGAAIGLHRQGDVRGMRIVLVRCYEESWLLRCLRDGHLAELNALRRLGHGAVGAALTSALDDASGATDNRSSLEALIVSLSALRLLAIFDEPSPRDWWERAVRFNPGALQAPGDSASRARANNLAACIRSEGIARLLAEHREAGFQLLIDTLYSEDQQLIIAAIDGLQTLKDRRALPHLHSIAFGDGSTLAAHARKAIEHIAGRHADELILLRSSHPQFMSATLLRAAGASHGEQAHLVRMA